MRWPEDFEQRFSVSTQLLVCHVRVIYWILLFAKTLAFRMISNILLYLVLRLDGKKAAPLPATSLGPSPSLKFVEESGILPTDQGRPCRTGHLVSRLHFGRWRAEY